MPPKNKSIDTIIKNSDLAQHLSGYTQDSKEQSMDERVKTALNFLYSDFDKDIGENLPPNVAKHLKERRTRFIEPEMRNVVESLGEELAKKSFMDYYKLYKDDPEVMDELTSIWEKSGKPYFRKATKAEHKKHGTASAALKEFSRDREIRSRGKSLGYLRDLDPANIFKEGITPRDTVLYLERSPTNNIFGSLLRGKHNIAGGVHEMGHSYQKAKRPGESFDEYKKRSAKLYERGKTQDFEGRYKHLPFEEAVTHSVVVPFLKKNLDDIFLRRAAQSRISDFMEKDPKPPQVKVGKKLKSEEQIKEIMGKEFFKSLKDRGSERDDGKLSLPFYPFKTEKLKERGILPKSGPYKNIQHMALEGQSPETEYLTDAWLSQIERNKWESDSLETQKLPKIKSEQDLIDYLDWILEWQYKRPEGSGVVYDENEGLKSTGGMGEWIRGDQRGYTPYKK